MFITDILMIEIDKTFPIFLVIHSVINRFFIIKQICYLIRKFAIFTQFFISFTIKFEVY
jgi:hypothetical protein